MIRVNSFDANCFEAKNKLQVLEKQLLSSEDDLDEAI